MIKKHKNSGKIGGFTLIELLVVVAIIGILASMVIIGLNSTRKLARDSRRISDLRQIQSALELYFNACSVYPGGSPPVTAPGKCGGVANPYGMQSAAWGIAKIPDDPLLATNYLYCHDPTASQYTLQATLEDPGNSALQQSPKTDNCGGGVSCAGPNDYCVEL